MVQPVPPVRSSERIVEQVVGFPLPPEYLFVLPVGPGAIVLVSGHKNDVDFVLKSSMRKWRNCTFLHSVRRSMSPLRKNHIVQVPRLKALSKVGTYRFRPSSSQWRTSRFSPWTIFNSVILIASHFSPSVESGRQRGDHPPGGDFHAVCSQKALPGELRTTQDERQAYEVVFQNFVTNEGSRETRLRTF